MSDLTYKVLNTDGTITVYDKAAEIDSQLTAIASAWQTWEPTLSWLTAVPVGLAVVARYKQVGKTIHYLVNIIATDGNGATQLTVTPPVVPKTNNINPNISVVRKIGSTNGVQHGYVRDDGTNDDLWIGTGTLTALNALQIRLSGFYEAV